MNEISEEILKGCVRNDPKCQKLLYEFYYKRMYAICLRYAGDSHEAKDLLHDGFIKLFGRLNQVDSVKTLDAWMKRLFANHCIDYLKSAYKKYIKYEADFSLELIETTADEQSNGNFNELEQTQIEDLMLALNQLKPDYRIIINMYAIENYSHLEISQILGINESTSRSKLLRARKSLKTILKKNKP